MDCSGGKPVDNAPRNGDRHPAATDSTTGTGRAISNRNFVAIVNCSTRCAMS